MHAAEGLAGAVGGWLGTGNPQVLPGREGPRQQPRRASGTSSSVCRGRMLLLTRWHGIRLWCAPPKCHKITQEKKVVRLHLSC